METGPLNTSGKWLFSRRLDLLLLFLPVWAMWGFFILFQGAFDGMDLPVWCWVVFILGIDVGHVWSTLFRSYADREEFKAHKLLFILAPIVVFAISVVLLNLSVLWFWRIMAYLAVFHFIKQQYGFTALYQVKVGKRSKRRLSDKFIIYFSTLYPILYWHFTSDAEFNWFVQGDFFPLHHYFSVQSIEWLSLITNTLYWGVILIWIVQEWRAYQEEASSVGKILWVVTTALNWWLGIVYFNSDVIFSISNVVAHGIPYLALIYFYRVRKIESDNRIKLHWIKRFRWASILIVVIGIAAFIEEYFWDMLVYREHSGFFETVYPFHFDQLSNSWPIIMAMALLALPQQVHYVVDGFIWKFNARNPHVKKMFLNHES